MKKNIQFALLFSLFVSVPAFAQVTGRHYSPVTGGADRVLANSTNVIAHGVDSTNFYGLPTTATNMAMTVDEFDYVGFTWSYGAGSNATVRIFKSMDNQTTYEANPSYSFAGPVTSAAAFQTNALLDVRGCSHIAFEVRNASTLDMTNALIEIKCKASKVRAMNATTQ